MPSTPVRYVVLLLALAVLAAPHAAAQEAERAPLEISSNKGSYVRDDTVVVSVSVENRLADGSHVIITVWAPGDKRIEVRQGEPALDNNFVATFVTRGWDADGTYRAVANYGGYTAEAEFEYTAGREDPATWANYEVDNGIDGTFDVRYEIRGGSLTSLVLVPENLGLVAEIKADRGGSLRLEIPNEYVRSEENGREIPYIVVIDGTDIDVVEEDAGPDHRRIVIDFLEGESRIEVIGTFAVPEFGAAAALVMAAGAAAAAGLSARLGPRGRTFR